MKNRYLLIALTLIMLLSSAKALAQAPGVAWDAAPGLQGETYHFAGPFENTYWGFGGTVIIDMEVNPTSVGGHINFTNDPDVGSLCGAGNFNGTRSGDNFQFQFTSFDSDPGCAVADGTVFHVSGTLSEGKIVNGEFTHPSTGQAGTFTAEQTTHYLGTFETNGYPGTVTIDLATNGSSTVTGYMNFTNDPGVGTLCGAGSFRGTINSNGGMSYDFLSNDPDAGCGFDDGLEFAVSATLSSDGFAIENGHYTVVDSGQTGTFSTACVAGAAQNLAAGGELTGFATSHVCPVDTAPPTGKIIWPYDNTELEPGNCSSAEEAAYPDACRPYGPGDIVRIEAIADDDFSGVHRVEFWVSYDGEGHRIKKEYFPPYEADFTIPNDLRSQSIKINIVLFDKAFNYRLAAGGARIIDYRESYDNPGVNENWIPAGNRSYLNQRSLSEVYVYDGNVGLGEHFGGDYQCGGASVAMVLRMQEQIGGWYSTLSSHAQNAFVASTFWYNGGWTTNYCFNLISFMENNFSIDAAWRQEYQDDGWKIIKNEINADNPVIVLTGRNGTAGHYFVVVGYREAGTDRTLIVYDPYGRWIGPGGYFNYDANGTDVNSRKGQWAYYDYDQIWGYGGSTVYGRIMTVHRTGRLNSFRAALSDSPDSPADVISEEEENLVVYTGVEILESLELYIPIILAEGAD